MNKFPQSKSKDDKPKMSSKILQMKVTTTYITNHVM